MSVFKVDLEKKILWYAFIPIDINDKQLLHYISIVLEDYDAFSEFMESFLKFNLDIREIARRHDFPMMNELLYMLGDLSDEDVEKLELESPPMVSLL
jgi:hypothetical protein